MTLLTTWPAFVNDTGPGDNGTRIDQATLGVGSGGATMKAAIEALIHSGTNPTVTPANIIDEVVLARGSKASLDARLDVSLNNDGTLITPASLATLADIQSQLAALNVSKNSELSGWAAGAAAAPDNFVLSGAGAAVARCGSGEADTFSFGTGQYSAKITYGAANALLTEEVISAALMPNYTDVKGKKFVAACKLKSSIASHVRIVIDDGITTTASAWHTGGGSAEFIATAAHVISNSATKLAVYVEVAQAGAAYCGGFMYAFSDVVPSRWSPFSNVPDATETVKGLVTITAQAIAGLKTFRLAPQFYAGTAITVPAIVSGVIFTDYTARTTSSAGVETDLSTTTLPANSLSVGKVLRVKAWGKYAATGFSKRIRLYFGGVVILDLSNTSNNKTWELEACIMCTGAAAQTSAGKIQELVAPNTAPAGGNIVTFQGSVFDSLTSAVSGTIIVKTTAQDTTAAAGTTQMGCLVEVVG